MNQSESIPTPPTPRRSRSERHVDAFIAFIVTSAVAVTVLMAWIEFTNGVSPDINWVLYSLFATMLLVSETSSATWLKMVSGGVVTMSWTFAFSLVLLGSPTGAVAVLGITTLLAEVRAKHDLRRVLFNSAQVALALAFGGLTLFAFGIHQPITSERSIPITSGLAILCSGLVVFVTNGVIVCYVISVVNGERFVRTMRNGFAVSMTADGALLALAPIFVISLEYSWLMLPLLGIAAAMVYQSAVQALDRGHEANHDTLTELRNRRSFVNGVDQYLTERLAGDVATVLLIDLDGFKGINDRLGHQIGDMVLQSFAQRLSDALPAGAIVARLGGDEFAALIPLRRDSDHILDLTALHKHLVTPMTIDGFPLSVGASIGAATCPQHGESSADLLHAADVAMYRAKHFKTGVERHETTASTQQSRRDLLRSLAGAVNADQMSLEYEPLVHIRDRAMLSVEARLRWTHPTLGVIPRADFIALAEQTDLIGPLTDFKIEQAVRDVIALDEPSLSLSIDVAAGVLHDPHFARRTLSTLHRLEFDPSRLELELTERCLADDPERSRANLAELRAASVHIAIDDFGTGHSSFQAMRDLKIDRLKIAQTFIRGLDKNDHDRVIVQSVISLGHGLGVDVVGIGVETEAVWTELATMGCDIAQGRLIGDPMDLDALRRWIREDSTPRRRPALR